MSKTCKTCKFWGRLTDDEWLMEYHGAWAGFCVNPFWEYSEDIKKDMGKTPVNGVEYWDAESYAAGFFTGEDFGCIHWKQRDSK